MHKVLIADDEYYIISSLRHRINWSEYGYEIVDDAKNGLEAYEKIINNKPDLVLADISMPGMSGLELICKVSHELPDVKFIVVSGYAEFRYAKEAMNYGAIGYCVKPFDEDELIEILLRADKEINRCHTAEVTNDNNDKQEVNPYDKYKNITFRNILKYVDEKALTGYISVQEISEQFHLSENYISQLFTKEINTSFTHYTTTKRMEYACSLLRNTDCSISEIAQKSGYPDYFHFAKVFKKNTGFTPTEYRVNEDRKIYNIM